MAVQRWKHCVLSDFSKILGVVHVLYTVLYPAKGVDMVWPQHDQSDVEAEFGCGTCSECGPAGCGQQPLEGRCKLYVAGLYEWWGPRYSTWMEDYHSSSQVFMRWGSAWSCWEAIHGKPYSTPKTCVSFWRRVVVGTDHIGPLEDETRLWFIVSLLFKAFGMCGRTIACSTFCWRAWNGIGLWKGFV